MGWLTENRSVRRVAERVAPGLVAAARKNPALRGRLERRWHRLASRNRQLDDLRQRIDELEREVQESRRLQQRVAELTDVVGEVLIPLADRDDARVKRALNEFARTSF